MASDWANLPKHLLDSVINRLLTSSDYLRFSLVCMPWFSVAKDNQSRFKKMVSHQEPPMLLFFHAKEDAWSLYNVLDDKILDHVQLKMPNKRFCGSCKGWLIVAEEDFSVSLINPFLGTKGKIHLPPITKGRKQTLPDYNVLKATITADPISNANECIVIVTYVRRSEPAFIRIGEDEWTFIDANCCIGTLDVLQRGANFYALRRSGNLVNFKITSESYLDVHHFPDFLPYLLCSKGDLVRDYLVLSHENELLLVNRTCDWEDPVNLYKRFALEFRVFKFDFDQQKWIEKTSLGDDFALFIGENLSVSVVASNFPGCKPNCIYYNHDADFIQIHELLYDFGLYDMKTKKISKPYSAKLMTLLEMINQRPIWFRPTFYL